MTVHKQKKFCAAALAAMLCLSMVSFPVLAAETTFSSSGSAPGGQTGAPLSGNPGSGTESANTMTYDYSGTHAGALTADGVEKNTDGETFTATTANQNAALAENGGTLKITDGKLVKSGDDTNGNTCNFYGGNSILLTVGSASKAYVSGSSLNASSEGSNGIFSTNSATVYANDDTIATTAGDSRGLDATYDGNIIANKMTISTQGDHCASIASDRGGGNISVTNSSLSTAGSDSPLIYSTDNIQVSNTTGTATGSQLAAMEGLNTILIYDSKLESTIAKATASDPIADGIIIYQSTSGDAGAKNGKKADFEAVNSTLRSAIESGAMFYFTNTSARVVLSGTTLDFDSDRAKLMEVRGNGSNNWGTAGSNGARVIFTGLGETLRGDIDIDTISSLNLYLLEKSVYTGAITISTNASNTSANAAPATVNIDDGSKWVVTGNSTVTNLNAASSAELVDARGKSVSIVSNGKTMVQGDSEYTVTVTGSYTTTVSTGDDNALTTRYIDRTAFDSYYGTSTAFLATAASAASPSASASSGETQQPVSKTGYVLVAGTAGVAALLGVHAAKRKKAEDEENPPDDDRWGGS